MTLASLGWGVWWITAFLIRFAPDFAPGLRAASIVSCVFATAGFLAAVWTIRARLAWLLFALVPLFANASLLLFPFALKAIRLIRAEQA